MKLGIKVWKLPEPRYCLLSGLSRNGQQEVTLTRVMLPYYLHQENASGMTDCKHFVNAGEFTQYSQHFPPVAE